MLFAVLNKKGKIVRMSANLFSLLGYEKEESKKILKTQLESLYRNFILSETKMVKKGKVFFPRENGREGSIDFDLIIGRKGGRVANAVFILSPKEERLDIITINILLNSWEEPIILESEGVVILVNQKMAQWAGYESGELIGREWGEFFTLKERGDILTLSENEPIEVDLQQKRGERLNGWIYLKRIFWQEAPFGNLIFFQKRGKSESVELLNRSLAFQKRKLILLTEELEKMNKELLRLNEAKSAFVSAVSHDLRTPLTTIIEGIRLCEDGTLGGINPEQKKFLRLALDEANRLADFINDLLELSRIESGRITVKKRKLKMAEVIGRILNTFQKVAEKKGVLLSTALPKELPLIFADEGHCYRILSNLVGNAIKFTPAGGKVEITGDWHWEQSDWVLGVKDTGIGIPEKEKFKIFQKFCRIERNGKNSEPGTGLGLVLCKELVEINGGKIWFKSEENKGTEFYFSLPIYSEILELKDALKWGEGQAKRTNFPLALFLIDCLTGESSRIVEDIEKNLQREVGDYGFYRIVSIKNRIIVFLVAPAERVYDNYVILRDFLNGQLSLRPEITYHIFPPEEIREDEILGLVQKEKQTKG